jgi:hypothetical protein
LRCRSQIGVNVWILQLEKIILGGSPQRHPARQILGVSEIASPIRNIVSPRKEMEASCFPQNSCCSLNVNLRNRFAIIDFAELEVVLEKAQGCEDLVAQILCL